MASETDKEKFAAALSAKEVELRNIWLTEPTASLDEAQINEAVAQFKSLIPGYYEKGMSLELAMISAALAATAIINHPRKMIQAAEEQGLHSWDHGVEHQLFRIGEGFRVDVCKAMMCFLALEMGITRDLTPDDFAAIVTDKPLTYEEFPVWAFDYFRPEVERAIVAKTPLLN